MKSGSPRRRVYNRIPVSDYDGGECEHVFRQSQTRMEPLLRKRRRSSYSNLCIKIVAGLVVMRCIRSSILFTLNRNHEVLFDISPLDPPMLRSTTMEDFLVEQTIWKRRRRTRPFQKTEESGMLSFLSLISPLTHSRKLTPSAAYSVYPSFSTTSHVIGDDICGNNHKNSYGEKDRILISGIFSHPIAAELALALAERCNVRHIVGLSSHLLNAEESSRLEFLMRRIPTLQLRVRRGPLGDQATEKLFEEHSPTHVFYFESPSSQVKHFKTFSGTNQLEQLCNTMVKRQSHLDSGQTKKASLVYVTSSLPDNHGDHTNMLSVAALTKFKQILLETYQIQYQLDVKELHLPNIFGPFQGGAWWLLSDAFMEPANSVVPDDKNNPRNQSQRTMDDSVTFGMVQPIISLPNAIRSILVAGKMEYKLDELSILPILATDESQTTTVLELSKSLVPLLTDKKGREDKMDVVDNSLLPLISWNYKTKWPYRDPNSFGISPIENDRAATIALTNTRHHLMEKNYKDPAVISQLERRQHDIFPCLSVCASYVQCIPSAWDDIVSISRNVTKGCEFLVYTADFSPYLDTLPLVRDSTNNAHWPRESLCQLAFVSSSSAIVQNAIEKQIENNGTSITRPKNKWNGHVSSNGWTLIWINETEDSISEADYLVPKIVPESLLNEGVQYVFYIEPQNFEILPPLQIMWFLMSTQLNAAVRTKRRKKRGKKWLIPEQHIALFTHTYNETIIENLDPTKPNFMPHAAKLILKQSGKARSQSKGRDQVEKLENNRQLQAYENSLLWQNDEGLNFDLVDTPLMIFPIHNFRGKQLRCEWYEEQLFWANEDNRNLEGLSLSYVIHRMRRGGKLFPRPRIGDDENDKWGDMIMVGEDGKLLSPSTIIFRTLVEESTEKMPPSDPQHFVKLHSPLSVRKIY